MGSSWNSLNISPGAQVELLRGTPVQLEKFSWVTLKFLPMSKWTRNFALELHLHVHSPDDYNFNLLWRSRATWTSIGWIRGCMTRTGGFRPKPQIFWATAITAVRIEIIRCTMIPDQMHRADGASINNSYRPRDNKSWLSDNNRYKVGITTIITTI